MVVIPGQTQFGTVINAGRAGKAIDAAVLAVLSACASAAGIPLRKDLISHRILGPGRWRENILGVQIRIVEE